jgi:hypothetical protein
MYEFRDAFVASGTWDHAMDELRWFTDYFLRSLFTDSSGNVVAFAYQVGDGSVDHASSPALPHHAAVAHGVPRRHPRDARQHVAHLT